MNRYLCNTPIGDCSGGKTPMNNGWNTEKGDKTHSSSAEAFECYAAYLIKTGHEQIAPREFRQPQGGILVLTKKSRYGGKLRKGKNDLKGTGGKRYMPDSQRKQCRGGCFIG